MHGQVHLKRGTSGTYPATYYTQGEVMIEVEWKRTRSMYARCQYIIPGKRVLGGMCYAQAKWLKVQGFGRLARPAKLCHTHYLAATTYADYNI